MSITMKQLQSIESLLDKVQNRCFDIMNWKNENGIEFLQKEKYYTNYGIENVEVCGSDVSIIVHETWAYGGSEHHYYSFPFEEIVDDSWHENFLKKVNDKKIEIENKKIEEEAKRKETQEKLDLSTYKRLKAKYERE